MLLAEAPSLPLRPSLFSWEPLRSTLFLMSAAEMAGQEMGGSNGTHLSSEPPPPPPPPPRLLPDRRLLLPALAQLTHLQDFRLAATTGHLMQAVPSAWLAPGAFPSLRQ